MDRLTPDTAGRVDEAPLAGADSSEAPRRRPRAPAADPPTVRLDAVWSGLADFARRQGEAFGKRVELVATGGDILAPVSGAKALRQSLTQLVRNACDHGLESPAARAGAGKSAIAVLRLSARRRGAEVEVTLTDDGRGVRPGAPDPIPPSAVATLSADEHLEAARAALRAAGGGLALASTPGRGAAFTLTVPARPAPERARSAA